MTRLEIEKEVYAIMGLVDTNGTVTAGTPLRTYVQNKIQSALNTLFAKAKAQHRRGQFSLLLKAPVTTGTLSFSQYAQTAAVSGVTPDSSWIGGHVVISGNGFPLRIASVSSPNITFTEYIQAPTSGSSAYTMYFDGVLYPTDCQSIEPGTVKLSGKNFLSPISKQELERRQGYFGLEGDDYGFGGPLAAGMSALSSPSIGQPTVYTTWGNVTLSSVVRRIINVYPFPDASYTMQFDGFKKPTTLSADGDVPDLPEQFHLNVLVPRVKLDMCEFPGFELTGEEKRTLQGIFDTNWSDFKDDDNQDPGGDENWRLSSLCR